MHPIHSLSRRLTSAGFVLLLLLLTATPALAAPLTPRAYLPLLQSPPGPTISLLAFDGDSLTAGNGASSGIYSYPSDLVRLLGNPPHANTAVGASTLLSMAARAPTTLDPLHVPGGILLAWGGTNDLYYGANAKTALERLRQYCAERRAAGWRVIVLTLLPRSGYSTPIGFEAERQAFNFLLRRDWVSFADGLADVASDQTIGLPGEEEDTRYYTDRCHMTDAGYLRVALIVRGSLPD